MLWAISFARWAMKIYETWQILSKESKMTLKFHSNLNTDSYHWFPSRNSQMNDTEKCLNPFAIPNINFNFSFTIIWTSLSWKKCWSHISFALSRFLILGRWQLLCHSSVLCVCPKKVNFLFVESCHHGWRKQLQKAFNTAVLLTISRIKWVALIEGWNRYVERENFLRRF